MQTAGSVLRESRLKKGLVLAKVEEATKIKARILKKIEADEFDVVGSFAHIMGLVKNYGEFLELNTEFLAALLRRQLDFGESGQKPFGLKFPKFLLLARIPALAFLVLLLVFVYLVIQLSSLKTGPKLEVFQPAADSIVKLSTIQVSGITEPEAQVTVNSQTIPTKLSGEFSTEFELTKGINVIEIVARGRMGAEKKIVRHVELAD